MLAFAAVDWEVREALLEGKSKYFDIDVVSELLTDNEEEVPEDPRCK